MSTFGMSAQILERREPYADQPSIATAVVAAPFLTVITRHMPARAQLLANNVASLRAQTDQGYEQCVIVDREGRGAAWANANLRNYADAPHGQYVLVLDDDDLLDRHTAIAEVRQAALSKPGVIMTRMDHGPLGVLPDAAGWGKEPVRGRIGISAAICRRDVWQEAALRFENCYDGDFPFVLAAYRSGRGVVWLDRVLTRVQRISRGQGE
jgi:hypothetical protein